MNRPIFRFTAAASLAVAALAASPEAGHAAVVEVTVNGTTYSLSSITGSYNDNKATIEATPWWGDQTLASNVALAHHGDYSTTVSGGLDVYALTSAVDVVIAFTSGATTTGTRGQAQANVNYVIGSVVPAEIPEIDGAVLAQLALVLGVGWLLFAARREDMDSGTAA